MHGGAQAPDRPSLRRLIHRLSAGIERDFDTLKATLGHASDPSVHVRLLLYAGYRNATTVRLCGRVVRWREPLDTGEGMIARLRAMLAIYDSDEIAGVPVRLEGYGLSADAVSDAEGYFSFELPIGDAHPSPPSTCWEDVTISAVGRVAQAASIAAPVLAPGADSRFGIISDIDDTVVETGATNFLKNWRRVLIEEPGDRLAVPGAATLYGTIAGNHRAPSRPFFYVSSSPWNLYGFITEFMELNAIPHGPMFLKDYGLDDDKLIASAHDAHKLVAIETILAFYPDLRFLLIGDNGQHDVSIYAQAVRDFGPRVAGVFIRDVDGDCRAGPEGALLAEIEAAGVPVFCGAGFDDAITLARTLGLAEPVEAAQAVIEPAR